MIKASQHELATPLMLEICIYIEYIYIGYMY